MGIATKGAWPKLEVVGPDGHREGVIEMAEAAAVLDERTLDWLKTGQIHGTMCDRREYFRYTELDAKRDAAEELYDAAKALLDEHKRIEPHHHTLCKFCHLGNEAISKAECRAK